MRHDIISDMLSAIKNGDRYGKKETISHACKLSKDILILMQREGLVGEFEYIDDGKGGKFRIQLLGKVNNCNSIRPRYAVKKDGYEKFERRFLPASGMGFLIVSTSQGVLDHNDAKKKGVGGKLIAFVY